MNVLTAFVILTVAYAAVAAVERIPAVRHSDSRQAHFLTDIAWYGVSIGAAVIAAVVFRPLFERLAIPHLSDWVAGLAWPLSLLLAVVLYDAVAFHVHLLLHHSDTLWNIHKVHHSTRSLDGLATTRTHMMEHAVRNLPAQALLLILGVPISVLSAALLIYATFALLNHSNLRLPLRHTEWLFITPRLHRRHHDPDAALSNLGTIFTIWDRTYGRLVRHDTMSNHPLGVPGELDSFPQQFVPAFREPFRQIRADRTTRRSDPQDQTAKV